MINHLGQGVPTLEEAKLLLLEGQKLNPGPWIEHSMNAGRAAELIAKNCKGLNPDVALVLGMLHDIGVRFGVSYMKHILHGYNFAMEKGYYKLAKVCLTHSFECQDIRTCFGRWDYCSDEEYSFIKNYIESAEYDDYDRLIQLCDALALPSGFCLMEKRMVDVALRHGIHGHIINKWRATFKNKQYFEERMGKSIYSVLPGVIENTFDL
ncbi:HD domain-containing protein [Clostridium sp. FP2]|uniref:HD domain-containing protein n=1 Tax=Clostridium TaxID=1485 RepID=UPI0013E9943C|nr:MULTISPECIES: HD domain-containing protein [Clostridium]MBW9159024.1 HD domain-containing protein [Clostridium tagluense]MBZ9623716.1 HD domain-containing protein [Clostridium sp. FP2]WLC63630.1 HD domain-containing protein [Clostridium tagluense]